MGGLGEIFGVGGPVAGLAALLFVAFRYLIDRKGSSVKADRESESGIVESTNATLKIMRENQRIMGDELIELRRENQELRERLKARDEEVDKIYDQNRDLLSTLEEIRTENDRMRRRLEALEHWGGEVPAPPLESGPPVARRKED